MRRLFLLFLFACSGKDKDDGTGGDSVPSDSEPPDIVSSYTTGQYRVDDFTILGAGAGKDWDEDGQPNNQLPGVLALFDLALADYDLSKVGLNELIGTSLAKNDLVLLVDCTYTDGVLTMDLLKGMVDKKSKALSVDAAASYAGDGTPLSHLTGVFDDETTFAVGSAAIVVSVPIDDGNDETEDPDAPFPVEDVEIVGTLEAAAVQGSMVGIMPVDRFIVEVLPIFVPAKGVDIDGDEKIEDDETYAAIETLVADILEDTHDVTTSDGRAGVSAAFEFTGTTAAF